MYLPYSPHPAFNINATPCQFPTSNYDPISTNNCELRPPPHRHTNLSLTSEHIEAVLRHHIPTHSATPPLPSPIDRHINSSIGSFPMTQLLAPMIPSLRSQTKAPASAVTDRQAARPRGCGRQAPFTHPRAQVVVGHQERRRVPHTTVQTSPCYPLFTTLPNIEPLPITKISPSCSY